MVPSCFLKMRAPDPGPGSGKLRSDRGLDKPGNPVKPKGYWRRLPSGPPVQEMVIRRLTDRRVQGLQERSGIGRQVFPVIPAGLRVTNLKRAPGPDPLDPFARIPPALPLRIPLSLPRRMYPVPEEEGFLVRENVFWRFVEFNRQNLA